MKRLFLFLYLCLIYTSVSYAQHTLRARIVDHDSGEPLPGATAQLRGTTIGATADADGLVEVESIPAGRQTIVFSFVGYESQQRSLQFPMPGAEPLLVELEPEEELEAVVVSATRSSRTIEDIPTRVEAISGEELGEKAVMNSTNIAMLLRESTGIQMQQTSANSANQSIRIQGLDGRYTQLLRDGFPLYSGFASGLSIMQVPPLDLQQVEVIKGSASTLYGGGAIAGLVNLVTKKPGEEPELSLMLNQTSAMGTTLNTFYSGRNEKWGSTIYASGNLQQPYDPNDDGFSDIPQVRSLTLNPRLFRYFGEDATLWVGVNASLEERIGGDIVAIESGSTIRNPFTEQNNSKRVSSQLAFEKQYADESALMIKNSISYFDRDILVPDYSFAGEQWASFTEASYSFGEENSRWIGGLNLFTDQFSEQSPATEARDYSNTTIGAFAQHTWQLQEQLALESGLRTDYNTNYGTFVLPRLSFMYKPVRKFTARLGGGLGYKLPTVFTEEAEAMVFRNVLPITAADAKAERSYGGNFDINYSTGIGENITFSLNQLFFYTQLQDALVLNEVYGQYSFNNADGPVRSRGSETNARFTWGDFKLFLQYAFTDVELQYQNLNRQKPLTPRHTAGAVLMFEQHGKWRIGYEAYYTGQQYLSDFSQTRDYWIMGLMALREMESFSLFLNFENFVDARQSRYSDIVYPPYTNPSFAQIWAPTDGFVINGGFIWKIFGGEHH
ncbi:TonB-dependent Receptor [Flammeovirgaceae bacterium 311]|nr:TonB-dependent Receptor [Flammeovirgaceae bacterium 311]